VNPKVISYAIDVKQPKSPGNERRRLPAPVLVSVTARPGPLGLDLSTRRPRPGVMVKKVHAFCQEGDAEPNPMADKVAVGAVLVSVEGVNCEASSAAEIIALIKRNEDR
jgi:hypothetical protein